MFFQRGKAGEDFVAPIGDRPVTAIRLRRGNIQIDSADGQMERPYLRAVHILQVKAVAQVQAVQIRKIPAHHALAGSGEQAALIKLTEPTGKVLHQGTVRIAQDSRIGRLSSWLCIMGVRFRKAIPGVRSKASFFSALVQSNEPVAIGLARALKERVSYSVRFGKGDVLFCGDFWITVHTVLVRLRERQQLS